ncbi:MAG: methylmalonyl Co-A mutase-associated GTPase MeaB [Thermoplasmata archaeon]|nr:MAG: methylmalonyl Co-A mutase-associated GTPase MeaB [Thermoplasmata archaeon]
MRNEKIDDIIDGVISGDKRAIARAITVVESLDDISLEILEKLSPYTRRAHILGITGPPGVGKSTLIDRLIREYRRLGRKVAVIAVDPTSPYTGGALLGDRIRMQRHATDEGVFIRSIATRGSIGALSRSTIQVAKVLDAAGYDPIIIETVGAGQSDLDIIGSAHTILLVLMPNLGDDIQALKAGILEAADIIVINKSDLPHADTYKRILESVLEEDIDHKKIVMVSALSGKGIEELMKHIEAHRQELIESGRIKEKKKEILLREVAGVIEVLIVRDLIEKFERELENEQKGSNMYKILKEKINKLRALLRE